MDMHNWSLDDNYLFGDLVGPEHGQLEESLRMSQNEIHSNDGTLSTHLTLKLSLTILLLRVSLPGCPNLTLASGFRTLLAI
jgi:hypothetical protein